MQLVNLEKGVAVDLTKQDPAATMFSVGLKWDKKEDTTQDYEFDLDLFAIKTDEDGKGATADNIAYFGRIAVGPAGVNSAGQEISSKSFYAGMDSDQIMAAAVALANDSMAVVTKDNLTGEGDGDDETMFVNRQKFNVGDKLIIAGVIYESAKRRQNLGMAPNPKIQIYNEKKEVLAKYPLGNKYAAESGVIIGEFFLEEDTLGFKARGEGFTGDINTVLQKFA